MAAAALTACHFGQVAIPVPVDRPLGLLAIQSCVAKRNSSRAERAGKPTWTSQMTVSLAEAFRCKRRLVSIGVGHGVPESRPRATALPPIVSAAGSGTKPAAVCCIVFSRSCPDSGFLIPDSVDAHHLPVLGQRPQLVVDDQFQLVDIVAYLVQIGLHLLGVTGGPGDDVVHGMYFLRASTIW